MPLTRRQAQDEPEPVEYQQLETVRTRKANKDKHPGYVDKPPKKSRAEKAAEKAAAEAYAARREKEVQQQIEDIWRHAQADAAAHAREVTPPPYSAEEMARFEGLLQASLPPPAPSSELSEPPSDSKGRAEDTNVIASQHNQVRDGSEPPSDLEKTIKKKGKGKPGPREIFRALDEQAEAEGDAGDAMVVDEPHDEQHNAAQEHWLHSRRSSGKRVRDARESSVEPEETPIRPASKRAKKVAAPMVVDSEPEDNGYIPPRNKGKERAREQTPPEDRDAEELTSGIEDMDMDDSRDQHFTQQAQLVDDYEDNEDEANHGQYYEQQQDQVEEYERGDDEDEQQVQEGEADDAEYVNDSPGHVARNSHYRHEESGEDFRNEIEQVLGTDSNEEPIPQQGHGRNGKSQRAGGPPPPFQQPIRGEGRAAPKANVGYTNQAASDGRSEFDGAKRGQRQA